MKPTFLGLKDHFINFASFNLFLNYWATKVLANAIGVVDV